MRGVGCGEENGFPLLMRVRKRVNNAARKQIEAGLQVRERASELTVLPQQSTKLHEAKAKSGVFTWTH